ncbi:MAG: ABC transporter permease [Acidobacteria bacterium]|nr:ABC transporter permease [Acidobacteriota bacterium]
MTGAWAVAIKELRQIRRDRRTLVILVFLPTFFLFLYGYALNFDVRHVAIAVEDRDLSAASRAVVAAFERSGYFDVVADVGRAEEASALIDRGTARAVIVIPAGFSRDLRERRPAALQVLIDGDNATTATTVLGYVDAVIADASARVGGPRPVTVAAVEPRIWYNPELRSTVFLVPGLIAFISMITAVVSTALSIVREKERGTMEQVRMAPVSTLAFVLGKTVPYLVMSQIGAAAILVAAMYFFDLPMRGSWIALMAVLAVFLLGALGTGLAISTIADTQQVAFQAAALVAMLPTLILSGFIFPIASMPLSLQYVTAIVPARYFLTALRGIVLKGRELSTLGEPLGALALYAAVALGVSALRLRRQ